MSYSVARWRIKLACLAARWRRRASATPSPILPRMLHVRTLFCSDLLPAFWLVIKKLARHRLQR